MRNVIESLPLPPVYYRPEPSPCYYREDDSGRWIKVDQTTLRSFVMTQGYDATKSDGISEVDDCMLGLQARQNVAYVGPLAGYRAGLYTVNRQRVLVTESPTFIEPQAGEWPTLKAVFDAMFTGDTFNQRDYLFAWWKLAVAGVRSGEVQASQMLALVGPAGAGKSLTQGLITETLGGRSAKPYLSMCGRTAFNADLFRAEHLIIDDEAEDITIEKRRHFAAAIKGICVNPTQHCHGKNKDALTLTPVWRLTCSVNDDPERVQVLPPLDDDVADKLVILSVRAGAMPMPSDTPAARQAFKACLAAELPAFLHHLENWEIPEALRVDRYGLRPFHHPDVVEALRQGRPELRLLDLIDADYFRFSADLADAQPRAPWDATAAEIERHLTRVDGPVAKQASQLLRHHTHCGTYLSRLVTAHGTGRVTRRTVRGNNRYSIQGPPAEEC